MQLLSCVWLFATPWTLACQVSLPLTISQSLSKFMSIELVMPFNYLTPFSFCPQSFLVSGSFPVNWLFTSGGQSIGASASVLPVNIQGWFPLDLIGLVSLPYGKVKVKESEVAQSCLILCDPMDCSLPGSSIQGIFPGKNTTVGCHFLLQGIFPTQGSNPGLPYFC